MIIKGHDCTNAIIDGFVKSQNNGVPRGRGRYRHRYRTLIGSLFDPDTDSDPDADKADMLLFTMPSLLIFRNSAISFPLIVRCRAFSSCAIVCWDEFQAGMRCGSYASCYV